MVTCIILCSLTREKKQKSVKSRNARRLDRDFLTFLLTILFFFYAHYVVCWALASLSHCTAGEKSCILFIDLKRFLLKIHPKYILFFWLLLLYIIFTNKFKRACTHGDNLKKSIEYEITIFFSQRIRNRRIELL